ncbi:hypothetical protein OROGR_023724 [Orobanche gracilis]
MNHLRREKKRRSIEGTVAAGLTAVVAILAVVTSGGFEIRLLPLDRRVPMAACDLPRRLVLDFRSGSFAGLKNMVDGLKNPIRVLEIVWSGSVVVQNWDCMWVPIRVIDRAAGKTSC